MPHTKGPLILALLIVTVGIGWLLTAMNYVPEVNWVWTLGLAVVGLLAFVLAGGVNKMSIVIGPFFLAASSLSVLRQTQRVSPNIEAPVLVILVGVLIALACLPAVPVPHWLKNGAGKPPAA